MSTDYPVTMAIRVLRQHEVEFTPHLYVWEARGGTAASAASTATSAAAGADARQQLRGGYDCGEAAEASHAVRIETNPVTLEARIRGRRPLRAEERRTSHGRQQ